MCRERRFSAGTWLARRHGSGFQGNLPACRSRHECTDPDQTQPGDGKLEPSVEYRSTYAFAHHVLGEGEGKRQVEHSECWRVGDLTQAPPVDLREGPADEDASGQDRGETPVEVEVADPARRNTAADVARRSRCRAPGRS